MLHLNDDKIELLIYDPWYRVIDDGSVWTCKPTSGPCGKKACPWRRIDRFFKEGDPKDGKYRIVTYYGKYLKLHRIIYRYYVGYLDPNLVVNHIDCDTWNNFPYNLELVTDQRNYDHADENGLILKGEDRPETILTNAIARQIKIDFKNGMTGYAIWKQMGN